MSRLVIIVWFRHRVELVLIYVFQCNCNDICIFNVYACYIRINVILIHKTRFTILSYIQPIHACVTWILYELFVLMLLNIDIYTYNIHITWSQWFIFIHLTENSWSLKCSRYRGMTQWAFMFTNIMMFSWCISIYGHILHHYHWYRLYYLVSYSSSNSICSGFRHAAYDWVW